jgi:subtilase family serine protease
MQKWLNMENKLQKNRKKFLTVTVLTLFLLSATAFSSVSAQLDSTRIPDQPQIDASSELVGEDPTLYTAQDNSTDATAQDNSTDVIDDNSPLGRIQDNSTASADDSTVYETANSESENQALVAAQAQTDDLACIIVLVAGVAAIVSLAIFVNRRKTKNSK